jgi:hypothetical protein
MDVLYTIERITEDGAVVLLIEYVLGEPNPDLSIRSGEAFFTLPPDEDGQALYRLRVRLLSPLP